MSVTSHRGPCARLTPDPFRLTTRILVADNQLFSSSTRRPAPGAWTGQVAQEFRGHRNCVLTLAYHTGAPWVEGDGRGPPGDRQHRRHGQGVAGGQRLLPPDAAGALRAPCSAWYWARRAHSLPRAARMPPSAPGTSLRRPAAACVPGHRAPSSVWR